MIMVHRQACYIKKKDVLAHMPHCRYMLTKVRLVRVTTSVEQPTPAPTFISLAPGAIRGSFNQVPLLS